VEKKKKKDEADIKSKRFVNIDLIPRKIDRRDDNDE